MTLTYDRTEPALVMVASSLIEGSKDLQTWIASPGPLRIIRSIDCGEHGELLHVSVSHAYRYPTWDELKEVKSRFFGDDKDAMIVLPRKELYVNVHPNCFHLWAVPKLPGRTGRWEYR